MLDRHVAWARGRGSETANRPGGFGAAQRAPGALFHGVVRRASCLVGVSAFLALVSRDVHSEIESRVALSLNWMRLSGAESCIDAGQLARNVERHLGRSVFASPATASRNIEGWIEPARPGWHVALRASDADGRPLGHRQLATTDENCASLERSIVLAVGLLAEAARGPSGALPDDVPAAPPPEMPRGAVAEPTFAPGIGEDRNPQKPPFAPAGLGQAEFGPAFDLGWGVLPDIALGVGLRATITAHRLWMVDFSSAFWVPQQRRQSQATASFARSDLALGACFVPWQSEFARLGTCLGATGGLLTTHGEGTKAAETAQSPMFAGYGRVIGLIRLLPPVWVTGSATLAVPTARWTFYHRAEDGNDIDVWQMPAVSAIGQLGLMLHFGS